MQQHNRGIHLVLVLLATAALVALTISFAACQTDADGPEAAEPVRNVIIMISDGCGFNHLRAANLYEVGEPGNPLYDAFDVHLSMTTFADGGSYDPEQAVSDFAYVAARATDSAAAATAMACGIKTYAGAIGVDPDGREVANVLERAEESGKATGVVTSVYFSHATPAGFVAHNESRNNYVEIANEMIRDSAVDVIMGCGHPEFDANGRARDERESRYVGGAETWEDLRAGRAGADADGDGEADPWTLVESLAEFEALQEGEAPARVLGVPQVATTLQQRRDTDADSEDDENAPPFEVPLIDTVPTLAQMTLGALNVLDDDPDGLVLMVEGGAVDWASHANQSGRVIEEQIDFNRAVEAVADWIEENRGWDESLLIVTADHECGYLTGPDAGPEFTEPVGRGPGNLPEMEWHRGGHTNQLVPLLARGAQAGQLRGLVSGTHPVRGDYVDNTGLARLLLSAVR